MSDYSKPAALMESVLGTRVVKTLASLATADMFTVTGECLITLFYGIVTGVGDGGATTIAINEKTSSIDLMAATTVTSDAVGTVYLLSGHGDIVSNGGAAPTMSVGQLTAEHDSATDRSPAHSPILFDGGTGLTIELTQTGADATHEVKWVLFYIPLEENSSIVAA
jgi:hypothetical protein